MSAADPGPSTRGTSAGGTKGDGTKPGGGAQRGNTPATGGDASDPAGKADGDAPGLWSRWRTHRRNKKAAPTLPPKQRPETIEGQVADIYERFVSRTNAEVTGLWEMLGSRRRLMWVNFLAGLSRGIGFFLGVTLVGGLVIGGTALVLDTTAEILGWKDVTFASMVQSMYGKFQEVRNVIENMEEPEEEAAVDTASLKAPTLRSPFEDAFPTSDYPFEDGPLPGKLPIKKPPGLTQPPGLDGGPR